MPAFLHPGTRRLPCHVVLPNCWFPLPGPAGVGNLTCPDISREEIVNACGIDDLHDGVNYTRTACVIAVSKARDMFEPFLHQVRAQGG